MGEPGAKDDAEPDAEPAADDVGEPEAAATPDSSIPKKQVQAQGGKYLLSKLQTEKTMANLDADGDNKTGLGEFIVAGGTKAEFAVLDALSGAELEAKFNEAVEWVKIGVPDKTIPTEKKLDGYKYYKQANEGDVEGSQPWAIQIESRAKWDAWDSCRGMSKEDAMRAYIDGCWANKAEYGVKDPSGNTDFTH